jgi:nucleoside phosphorylase
VKRARQTLVVSAWEPEVAPLRRMLARRRRHATALVLEAVGIGAVDAAVGAARAIAASAPARVVFVGTAGAYAGARGAPPVGAAAVASDVHLVSTAALRGDGYAPGPLVVRAASDAALAEGLRSAAALPACAVACPLAITRAAALGRRIAAATGAALENLEAFAVARAAAAAGVPFAAVLGVANRVGPGAHAAWRANHARASAEACRALLAWLDASA